MLTYSLRVLRKYQLQYFIQAIRYYHPNLHDKLATLTGCLSYLLKWGIWPHRRLRLEKDLDLFEGPRPVLEIALQWVDSDCRLLPAAKAHVDLKDQHINNKKPFNDLTGRTLDFLLESITLDSVPQNFQVWQTIYIRDPTAGDETATWSTTHETACKTVRIHVLPFFLSQHWQLAVFDTVNHNLFHFDCFLGYGTDSFTSEVCLWSILFSRSQS